MSRVSINAGLLQMIVNGLKRDFAEGKTIRGELVEDIERDARPIEDAAAEPNRAVELSRDDVIRMAREVGFYFHDAGHAPTLHTNPLKYSEKCFERFAALVAEAERQECEKACESIKDEYMRNESGMWAEMKSDAQTGAADCVAAIRARGEKP